MSKIKTILIVEDEVLIALSVKLILTKEGYFVNILDNGEDAIRLMKNSPYSVDLILMDINLGNGIDGTETAKVISEFSDVPILFHSSHQEKEIVEKTEKLTSYGYIIKSSTDFVLLTSIKMAFKLYEANKEKSRSNESFQVIFDNSPVSKMIHEIETGKVIYVNKTAFSSYGFQEISDFEEDFFAESPYSFKEALDYIHKAKEKDQVFEWKNVKKDGTVFWEYVFLNKIVYKNKDRIMSTSINITDLKKIEKEKDDILREAQHRMKNSLVSIESLISLQLMNVKSQETEEDLIDIKGRVQSIRLVYDKILETQKYNILSVRDYFNDFIEAIITVFKNGSSITIKKDIDDFNLCSKHIFSLGVITNEFITNSMKYAFKGEKTGSIELNIKKIDNKVFFELSDNGIGMKEEQITNSNDSFGILLMYNMCKQLNSEYKLYNDNGMTLKVIFNI